MTPSPNFIRLTRNPDLPRPIRFEPTRKELGDVIIGEGFRVERRGEAA